MVFQCFVVFRLFVLWCFIVWFCCCFGGVVCGWGFLLFCFEFFLSWVGCGGCSGLVVCIFVLWEF